MDLVSELKQVVSGEVSNAKEDLEHFSRDASLFKVVPAAVVAPRSAEDLKKLVKFVSSHASQTPPLSLTARSAGTDMSGGPLTESIVVNFLPHFNKFLELGRDYAVVQPGVYYRDFEKHTLLHNLIMPSYPASRELCTVGGIVSNNSGGEKSLVYGKTENYIKKLKVVLADGEEHTIEPMSLAEAKSLAKEKNFQGQLYRQVLDLVEKNYDALQEAKPKVSKNSAGYYLWNVLDKDRQTFDLTKLLVGSQGTLGLVTEITFKLVQPKTHSQMLVMFMKKLDLLPQIVNHLLKFNPESIESYDDHTFKMAMRLFPQIAKRLKGDILKLAWQFLPEFFMVLTGGVPKLVIMVEFTGDSDEEVASRAAQALASLKEFHIETHLTKTAFEAQKYWTVRRESFNLLRQHLSGMRTAPFIDDFIVRPEFLPEFLPQLDAILAPYKKMMYTIAGHVGDGNFHIIPLIHLNDPEAKKDIQEIAQKVYPLVFKYHGSMTGEHNDGLIRSPFLEEMYGQKICELFAQTKRIFDPQNIFNPGKKVGASWNYAVQHLDLGS